MALDLKTNKSRDLPCLHISVSEKNQIAAINRHRDIF